MLLLPLGIDPTWVAREDLTGRSLYYGPRPGDLGEDILRFRLHPGTLSYFERRTAYQEEWVRWRRWDGEQWPILFGNDREDDLIASAFFWLSGWQEHTLPERDRHGRFPHQASLQARLGMTSRPSVDAYRDILAAKLIARGIPLHRRTWGDAIWALCPTHDIDYLRKWRKGMVYREIVEYLGLNRRHVSLRERFGRFGRFVRDWLRPGDVYRYAFERMQKEVSARQGTATYFFKTAAHGPNDVFYNPEDAYLGQRIGRLEESGYEIGLHPSYHAHTHKEYLVEERDRLDGLLTQTPISVRQHFLRYESPATPRIQREAGFWIDSSLGFSEHEGFRHATCLPFLRFDTGANEPLNLWEMPLAVMESFLFNRRELTPEEARQATLDIMRTCRRFGGVAVMLWHNVLWDELDHPGWGQHFIDTLDAALDQGGKILSLKDALGLWLREAMVIAAG
ncbi:MAG: polysaccharide deacetylase family protein [Rhodothermales bacterium]